MRLLYVARGYTTHDRRFLEALSRDEFEVHYLRLSSVTLDRRPLPAGVVPVAWIGDRLSDGAMFDDVRRWLQLRKIVRNIRASVALAGPVPTAAFLLALTGFCPFVAMSWGSDLLVDARQSRVAGAKAGYALRRAAGFFGDCRAVADEARRRATFPDDCVVLFPWGIDHRQFFAGPSKLSLRRELGWEDKRVVICTRSWEPVYAIDVLVRAFSAVAPEFADGRLLLLGDGSRAAEIHKLIDGLGVRDRVHAQGRIDYDTLPEYFRLADIYASSALSDGSSVSLLEAMACGLPAVVTGAFGNLEWVRSGENGWLAEPRSVDSLAACLREALAAPADRLADIGRANAAVARERADWDRNFPRLSGLLRRIANEDGRKA
jgi:L-malate glycosyltransferase